ncbi:MAG: nucleotidyltransferase family protein [Anaerolineales bacterium]|nr:nucleotidyltransferase family protein [Anaerolineales bacterium]
MDAIILAGGIPLPEDPLYSYSKGDAKALVDVAGKPMIQWVLDALSGAKHVDNVIIVGLSPKNKLKSKKPLHYISNQGRMLANIVAGVNKSIELDKNSEYVMVASTDIPALKPEMVDWLVETCMETKDDLYYGVCTREVMEKRFPGSKRTYTKLKDIELCGADINITHVRMATEHLDMWESLIGSRKTPLKQAGTIGLGLLWQVFTRSITLEELAIKISKRIGIKGRAIIWPQAEPCMDVDKPHQLELLRKDLAKVQKKAGAKKKKPAARKKTAAKTTKSKTEKPTKKKVTAKAKPAKTVKTMVKAKEKPKAKPKAKSKATAVKTKSKPKVKSKKK